jgi:hypothetical protein
MRNKLLHIFGIMYLLSCSPQNCKYQGEIPIVFNIQNETDREKICKIYDSQRSLFLSYKNHSKDFGLNEIKLIFTEAKVSENSINKFIEDWKLFVKDYRIQTSQSDSVYFLGYECLNSNITLWSNNLNNYITLNRTKVDSCLKNNQIEQIKKGISDYRKFNLKKKEEFFEQQTRFYGDLGKNLIKYNQLSFDLIDKIMTSEYDFGIKDSYKQFILELYNDNSRLINVYKDYKKLEESIVQEITSEVCFKRVGIIRYYDGLNNEEKDKAIKINMLMNFYK